MRRQRQMCIRDRLDSGKPRSLTSDETLVQSKVVSSEHIDANWSLDDLDDLQLELIIDALVGTEYGFVSLANLMVAFKRVWLLEKIHKYKHLVVLRWGGPNAWRLPTHWFLQRTGRVGLVEVPLPYDVIDDDVDSAYLDAIQECGAALDYYTDWPSTLCLWNYQNIVSASIHTFGFAWEGDVENLVQLLSTNPNAKVAISSYECRHLETFDVLRRITHAEHLKPFADRLDMSDFSIYGRTHDICVWAQEAFPTAYVRPYYYTDPDLLSNDNSVYSSDEEEQEEEWSDDEE